MKRSYSAEMVDGQFNWVGESPPEATRGRVLLEVTIKSQEDSELDRTARVERMRAAFARLRESNPFAEITDPVAWQREIRKDKPLDGRD